MGKTAPNLDVYAFRYRDDTVGITSDGGWLYAQDTNPTIDVDTTFRIRAGIEENVGGNDNIGSHLEYSYNSGTWTTIPTSSGSPIYFTTSSQFTDGNNSGSATTQLLTGATQNVTAGVGDTDNNIATGIGAQNALENEYALRIDSTQVSDADTIAIRWVTGTADATYTSQDLGTITVNEDTSQTVTTTGAAETNAFGSPTVIPDQLVVTGQNTEDLVSWKATGWRYDETDTDYINSSPAWTSASFDPDSPPGSGSAFETGQAALYRGVLDDLATETALNTLLTETARICYFAIYDFTITYSFSNLQIEYAVDDGMVVYLNATEIERDNWPDGPSMTVGAPVARTLEGNKEGPNSVSETPVIGSNRVAVAFCNNTTASSDNVWDMHLYGDVPTTINAFGSPTIDQGDTGARRVFVIT